MTGSFYVKINAVYQKLKQAEENRNNIYLHAPVGAGKTMAVKYYLREREKECVYLTGKEGFLSEMPEPQELVRKGKKTLVADDISWITDEKSKQYIRTLTAQTGVWLILIGRNRMPDWLLELFAAGNIVQADENAFLMNESHAEKLLKHYGIEAKKETLERMVADSKGYPLALSMMAARMTKESGYGAAVFEEAWLDCYRYFDHTFFNLWRPDLRDLLLGVSDFASFDTELAGMITGNPGVMELLEYAYTIGDFLLRDPEGRYTLRPILRNYLHWKQKLEWSETKYNEVHERAIIYYELKGDIASALAECKKCRNEEKIVELLVKNARMHPGTGHFYETKQYYMELPEKVIQNNPTLMAGMSMLYSLICRPDQSEYWYDQLCNYEKEGFSDNQSKREARSRIAYLDIALPHRGVRSIIEIFKSVARLCAGKDVSLPEFSVTSNLPGIMNGGKDFCEWSRIDKELSKVMKLPLEIVLGKYGAGLVNIALAESAFEKSSEDDYQIMTLLNDGYRTAEIKGKPEICFAALGILCKLHVQRNQLRLAEKLLQDFETKAIKEQNLQLLPNLQAMQTWFQLQKGNHAAIREWLATTPNEYTDFYILDRYRYLIKLRCLIALEQYDNAWNLSERLDSYFTEYQRHYMWIENTLLRAIICYRQKRKQWKELFEAAYQKAESYHFLWIIAQEGMAVLPLLTEWSSGKKVSESKSEYGREVLKKTKSMSFQYPRYLEREQTLSEPLTEVEKHILQLTSSGKSSAEIMDLCKITERTLRFHNGNIYKKLGVKTKSEAILAAGQLGIVN